MQTSAIAIRADALKCQLTAVAARAKSCASLTTP